MHPRTFLVFPIFQFEYRQLAFKLDEVEKTQHAHAPLPEKNKKNICFSYSFKKCN